MVRRDEKYAAYSKTLRCSASLCISFCASVANGVPTFVVHHGDVHGFLRPCVSCTMSACLTLLLRRTNSLGTRSWPDPPSASAAQAPAPASAADVADQMKMLTDLPDPARGAILAALSYETSPCVVPSGYAIGEGPSSCMCG